MQLSQELKSAGYSELLVSVLLMYRGSYFGKSKD